MKRFWMNFSATNKELLPVISLGCGVTARNKEEALAIVQEKIFNGKKMPTPSEVIENIDISSLDEKHIRPNMGSIFLPGIWFPLGFN